MLRVGVEGKHHRAILNGDFGNEFGGNQIAAAVGRCDALEDGKDIFGRWLCHGAIPIVCRPLKPRDGWQQGS